MHWEGHSMRGNGNFVGCSKTNWTITAQSKKKGLTAVP